jgi:hypothetical protein
MGKNGWGGEGEQLNEVGFSALCLWVTDLFLG